MATSTTKAFCQTLSLSCTHTHTPRPSVCLLLCVFFTRAHTFLSSVFRSSAPARLFSSVSLSPHFYFSLSPAQTYCSLSHFSVSRGSCFILIFLKHLLPSCVCSSVSSFALSSLSPCIHLPLFFIVSHSLRLSPPVSSMVTGICSQTKTLWEKWQGFSSELCSTWLD